MLLNVGSLLSSFSPPKPTITPAANVSPFSKKKKKKIDISTSLETFGLNKLNELESHFEMINLT